MKSEPISLLDLPHDEARRLCQSGHPIVLSVNPVEYHGPHLSLHNDRLISRGLARDLAERLGFQLVLAGDVEVGVEPCPGPGTRHTSYQHVRSAVVEACRALIELGVRRVLFTTFHGSPLHNMAIDAGVRELEAAGVRALSPFNLVLQELVAGGDPEEFADALDTISDPAERAAMAAGLSLDFHAGFFETSVALNYAPASVSDIHRQLPPCPEYKPDAKLAAAARVARSLGREQLARELQFAAMGVAWNALRPFPGYTGRPHLANPVAGAAFANAMLGRYALATTAVFERGEPAPAPIMPWIAKLSANGRLGQLPRPSLEEIATLA